MPDQQTTQLCDDIARQAHAHQQDKAGLPYVHHLERVVRIVAALPGSTALEVQAAWLHDIMEDQGVKEASLVAQGAPAEVVEVVRLLSKPAGTEYLPWVRSIVSGGNLAAVRVKLADNLDNQSPERPATPGHVERMVRKYWPAENILREALRTAEGASG